MPTAGSRLLEFAQESGQYQARFRLTIASLEIANTYAPLGAGFATFGSNVTTLSEYYLSLYYDYGLSTVWGLRPTGTQFVSDTFSQLSWGNAAGLGFSATVLLW